MKNRIALPFIMLGLVAAALVFFPPQEKLPAVLPHSAPQFLSYEGSIGGNSEMEAAPGAYLVVALPDNYRNDSISQEFISQIQHDETYAAIRSRVATRVYLAGHDILKMMNVKTTPAVIIINGEELLYKMSGPAVTAAVDDLAELGLDDFEFEGPINGVTVESRRGSPKCINCPKDDPEPRDDPDSPKNKEPELGDTPLRPSQPATLPEDNFLLVAIAVGALAAVVRYFNE